MTGYDKICHTFDCERDREAFIRACESDPLAVPDAVTAATSHTSLPYVVRDMRDSDRAFVVRTWLASNREAPMGRNAGPAYEPEHKALINVALKRSVVRVLADATDDDALWGFAVFELDATPCTLIHYVYVRNGMRRNGYARALVGDLVDKKAIVTHRTIDAVHRTGGPSLPSGWHFNPYRFFTMKAA